ncbi:hypothetical protein MYSTI_01959 [Myxococcus stipitatus DSM 14675]|uniref:AAA+ ATPase domain-containing protein n=1 Tax=Myxococcus stipitatus (strain DSM 14675 / JCM 12634 / Mx s8) TaxID=1278073 RepID=L7U581_MYXSD|nr:AAA family ATPase [Myxococcus stipitatus]AGC43288.1 hypothetical protein MYSTI_01959 [Myxococcus stipitatus DSM 14675]
MAFGTLATRKNAKLRLLLTGTSGSGKTYNALLIAKVLADGRDIGLGDSERGSSQKYAGMPGMPPFYAKDFEEKTPQEFIEFIREAAAAGISVFIGDSYSHAWMKALEIVDAMGGNKFSNGWKHVTPLLAQLTDALLSYPGHVICTAREKSEYVVEKDEKGRAVPRKVGMAPVLRDGADYDFDVVLSLSPDGTFAVTKTRCSALRDLVTARGNAFRWADVLAVAELLKTWLSDGAPVSPRDVLADRIRFASSVDALAAIGPDIKAQVAAGTLAQEDREALLKLYATRKAELTQAAEVML